MIPRKTLALSKACPAPAAPSPVHSGPPQRCPWALGGEQRTSRPSLADGRRWAGVHRPVSPDPALRAAPPWGRLPAVRAMRAAGASSSG